MPSSSRNMLLRIDLTRQTSTAETIPPDLAAYVGGMGLGVKLLLDEVPAGTDALSAGNKLIIAAGPLTGTTAPMFAQTCIVCRSPLSGTILNTYAGGTLGAEIKQAGYDAVVIEGAAAQPVLVFIDGSSVSFHSAESMRGLDTEETARAARRAIAVPEAKVVSIGLAGENRVRYAAALAEHRVFGRGGAGAVMGAKNLKAIAVYGTRPVTVHDPKKFDLAVQAARAMISKELENEWSLLGMFSRHGTGAGMGMVNERHALATNNHRAGYFEHASEIDGLAFEREYPTRPVSCFACPVHCGMLRRVPSGALAGHYSRGPEYETMYSLGSNLGLSSREALFELNELCDRYGLDTLTAGAVLSLAVEAAERGSLKDGLDLRFGAPAGPLDLIHKIARREGVGDVLAEGPGRAAEILGGGALGYAMQVKNSGYAAWMPRRMKGTGLSFVTSNRGACHKRAPIGAEIMGFIDGASVENKAAIVRAIQDKVNAHFTLVSCRFSEFLLPSELCLQLLEGATGAALSTTEFERLGERIWNLERVFNVAEGFGRDQDDLPAREFEPLEGEPSADPLLTRAELNYMLDEYYDLRGWDRQGVPTAGRLAELGLGAYSARIETAVK